MIITAGQLRGRRINCKSGKDIRPTSSKVRQAIFNSLFSMGIQMNGLRVLDLFAGTGIMSFESISRGGAHSLLVDNSGAATKLIQLNAENLGISSFIEIVNSDVIYFIEKTIFKDFNLIFMDPPYAYPEYQGLVARILNGMGERTIFVVESNKRTANEFSLVFPDKLLKIKNWGDTFVSFFRNGN
jgi:16S rRNA (guanine966-N2)-methyltransferase